MANSSPALSSLMLPPRTVSGSNGASPRSRGAKNGPRLVVFSGGTAFNLVASESDLPLALLSSPLCSSPLCYT